MPIIQIYIEQFAIDKKMDHERQKHTMKIITFTYIYIRTDFGKLHVGSGGFNYHFLFLSFSFNNGIIQQRQEKYLLNKVNNPLDLKH